MAEKFELKVSGEKIIGVLHRGEKDSETCIIMSHGLLSNKESIKYISLGKICEQLGQNAIRFDFRGCGESEGVIEQTTMANRIADLKAVIEFVTQTLDFNKLGLFGSSLGGYLSLLNATHNLDIKALVCISSPYAMSELVQEEDFVEGHLDIDGVMLERSFLEGLKEHDAKISNGLAKINCPVLLFQGDIDPLVPIQHSREIYKKLNCTKDLRILEGAAHLIISPTHLKSIIEGSIEWFNKYLWEGN